MTKTFSLLIISLFVANSAMADEYICTPKNIEIEHPACLGNECEMPKNTPKKFELVCVEKQEYIKNKQSYVKRNNVKQNLQLATIW